MAYVCDLGAGHRVYLDSRGTHTLVTLSSGSAGQQQQSSSSFQTGNWTAPPQAFRSRAAIVVQIETAEGKQFIQIQSQAQPNSSIQATSINLVNAAAVDLVNSLPMQQTDDSPAMQPMAPIEPMQPMQMGSMSMSMNPMSMRMGNMEMHMGSSDPSHISPTTASSSTAASSTASSEANRQFCNQCGAGIQPTDRFCAHCGTRLSAA